MTLTPTHTDLCGCSAFQASLPAPDLPLLRKVVEWAEAEAAKTDGTCLWNQREYIAPRDCGTAYCIAGYAVSISPEAEVAQVNDWSIYIPPVINGKERTWHNAGCQVLGLSRDEGLLLFDERNSIEDIRSVAEKIAARVGERL